MDGSDKFVAPISYSQAIFSGISDNYYCSTERKTEVIFIFKMVAMCENKAQPC